MAFIARERELAALAGVLQRAAEGQPSRVAVHGSVGIGTTSLVDELEVRLAKLAEVRFARGRAHAPCRSVPYSALAPALSAALATVPDDALASLAGQGAHDLVLLLPEIGERLAAAGAPAEPPRLVAPDQHGARVQESLLGVLERLAGDGVLCLAIEDIHHADSGTLEFVETLLRTTRRLPLALVITYHSDRLHRDHPAWPFFRRIRENAAVESLALAPFGHEELVRLIEGIQGERPSVGLVSAIREGSRGNPLVASQLVAAHRRLDGLRLSDPFDEIIHAQLRQLSPGAVQVLNVVALARRPIDESRLLAAPLPQGHVTRQAVADAMESGLAVRVGSAITAVHELCAEAIEAFALPDERKSLHSALAALVVDDPAEQAWHWDAALRTPEAREAHLAAAHAAERVEPGATALFHYQRVLELGYEPTPGARADLQRRSADDGSEPALIAAAASAAEAAGAFRRAAALIEQAIERRAGGRIERVIGSASVPRFDRIALGQLTERLGTYRRAGGDTVGAGAAFEQALQLIPGDAGVARAGALASLAQHLMLEGRFAESAARADEARAVARGSDSAAARELGHATCTLGVDRAYLGDLEGGLRLLEDATELSRAAGRLDDVIRAYANRTTLLDLDSRREQALAVVNEGIDEAARGGLGLTYGAFLRGNAADILFQLGRWEEAEVECRAAMEFPPAGVAWYSPILYLSLVLVESRADDEAARLVGQTLLQLETVPAGQWTALVQRAAVSLALWRGDADDARRIAASEWEKVLATSDTGQIAASASTVLEACAASAEAGRERRDWSSIAEAGELAERVLPLAERALDASDLPPTLGARREAELHLAMARAHAARIRGRARPEEWASLADRWRDIPVPYQQAKARWWQAAAALEARARRPEARAAIHEAWRISGELPARPLRMALAALAERGRISLPEGPVTIRVVRDDRVAVGPGPTIAQRLLEGDRARVADRFGLSPREKGVLAVLAEGRTNREIAERLFISERTVAVHVRRILAKLGVAGRVEAAGLAIRLGLVADDPAIHDLLTGPARR